MRWKPLVITLVLLVVVVGGGIFYLKTAAEGRFDKTYQVTATPIPIPFPLTKAEMDEVRRRAAKKGGAAATDEAQEGAVEQAGAAAGEAGADAAAEGKLDFAAIALQRALARGKHYVESRGGCAECHGADFSGKVLMDGVLVGTWSAPNITRAGVIKNYKSDDWVKIIRHGLKPNGKPSAMPSQPYASFSDQEISDIATYLRSVPPIQSAVEPSKMGPLTWLNVVRGKIKISAEVIEHTAPRAKSPPSTLKATTELGQHLATVCSACHGPELSGGPIEGGDPDWPPAKNLTMHATGLQKWSLEDFTKALREGTRPDGSKISAPMPVQYTKNFRDTEIEALYMHLKTVPPKETVKK